MKRGEANRSHPGHSHFAASARRENSRSQVPDELCRYHLEKVASSATFARAEQLRRLIEWLGYRSLAQDAIPPTEKEIGETVLRRKDFDPQTDSLVRKEMSRLREKLRGYYAKEGCRDRIHIRSVGGYLFHFDWSDPVASQPVTEGRILPCLLVLPFRADPGLDDHGRRLLEELLVQLGENGAADLVSPTTALGYIGRTGDIREFAAECGADFVVEGSLHKLETDLLATLWLVDGRSGRTERPGRFNAAAAEELARVAAPWLIGRLSR